MFIKMFLMDENECALMKFVHDDVGNGDVGHDQLVIMFEDGIHENRSTNVFLIFVLKKMVSKKHPFCLKFHL